MAKQLYRSNDNKIIAGICGGIAEYFDLDSTLVRAITVILVFTGLSPLFYLILWIIIPQRKDPSNG